MDIDTISQIALAVLGFASIVLIARKNKWGLVLGLLAEPFWLITAIKNKQWGIVFLVGVYAVTWSYGIYEWFSEEKQPKDKV